MCEYGERRDYCPPRTRALVSLQIENILTFKTMMDEEFSDPTEKLSEKLWCGAHGVVCSFAGLISVLGSGVLPSCSSFSGSTGVAQTSLSPS